MNTFRHLPPDPELIACVKSLTAKELVDAALPVALPLKTTFRISGERQAMVMRGPAGWGEFAPFRYPVAEATRWLLSCIEQAWLGLPAGDIVAVEVNATVPVVEPEEIPHYVALYPGVRTAKMKIDVTTGLDGIVARVAALREALGPDGLIRLDANMQLTVEQFLSLVDAVGKYDIDYWEQPVTIADMVGLKDALVAADLTATLAIDESIRRVDNPLQAIDRGDGDVAVLKVAPLGGVRRLVAVARHAQKAGMPVVVSSALDTTIGIEAGCVAAGLAGVTRACGLATGTLFTDDIAPERPVIDGCLMVHGPEPTWPRVERCSQRISASDLQFWREYLVTSFVALNLQLAELD